MRVSDDLTKAEYEDSLDPSEESEGKEKCVG
jgi:hypothetical protein